MGALVPPWSSQRLARAFTLLQTRTQLRWPISRTPIFGTPNQAPLFFLFLEMHSSNNNSSSSSFLKTCTKMKRAKSIMGTMAGEAAIWTCRRSRPSCPALLPHKKAPA